MGGNKMSILKTIKKIGFGLHSSSKRFPITLIYSWSTALLLIIINEIDSSLSNETKEMLIRINMILALGIPLSLCAKMFFEKNEKKAAHLYIYYSLVIVFQVFFYLFLLKDLKMMSISRYIGVNLAAYLAFIFIPHMVNKENFESYVIHVLTYFLVTYVYSLVLYGGLSAILFAIDSLLGINIKREIYFYTFLIVALGFGPAYFLAYVPERNKISIELNYSKILKILLIYIVMPLLATYALILYLYFIKIIITMEWPEGLVSHLVLWFSLILTLVLFFITPIERDNKWIANFTKWAPRTILPILIMMFVSMGIRINAYGITENRYYVLVLGLWIFAIMIYLSLCKKKKNIILPISLSIIILISILGPFSSFSISQYSQSKRFENILINNNMIKEGKIVPSTNISRGDRQTISSILSYFHDNHSLTRLALLPKDFKIEDMEDTLGFAYESPYLRYLNHFHFITNISEDILDISDYDYLIDANYIYPETPIENDELSIETSYEDSTVTITLIDSGDIYKKDFNDFGAMIYKKYGEIGNKDSLPLEEMIIEEEFKGYIFKFILQNFGGYINKNDDVEINNLSYYLLIKKN